MLQGGSGLEISQLLQSPSAPQRLQLNVMYVGNIIIAIGLS